MGRELQDGQSSSSGASWKQRGNLEQKWPSQQQVSNGNNNPDEDEHGEQLQLDQVIGHFGWYQLLIFIFKIGIGVTSAFNNLGVTFFAPTDFVGYWCADANTSSSSNASGLGQLEANPQATGVIELLAGFVNNPQRDTKHDSFAPLDYNTPTQLRKECTYWRDQQELKCSSFKYDTGIWISTIIEEWDLVCDRSWFISMNQSMYMSGFLVSFLVFGYISDRFGRWFSLMFGALLEISAGFGCAFANSAIMFMIFRFLVGFGNAGRSSSSYLMMIEWVGPRWRMHISTLGSLGWVLGYSTMPWLATYFLHFRHMQLFTCFYECFFVLLLLFLPESPRFLLARKRFDEARKVLLRAARINGLIKKDHTERSCCQLNNNRNSYQVAMVQLKRLQPEKGPVYASTTTRDEEEDKEEEKEVEEMKPYTLKEFEVRFKRLSNSIYAKEFTQNEHNLTIVDLFKWKNLRRYAMILFFIWSSNSFIYYGIVLSIGKFGAKNLFVSFTIAGLIELPSVAFTILCMKLMPRRTTNLIIFTSIGLLCAMQLPLKYFEIAWLQQTTMMLAKLINSISFTCILYQTMELFPTSIRQTAYGSCSLSGRIGSILAPFVKELAQVTNPYVVPIIYSVLSILSALLIIKLPETKGTDLHDTLLEAEKFHGNDDGQLDQQKSQQTSAGLMGLNKGQQVRQRL